MGLGGKGRASREHKAVVTLGCSGLAMVGMQWWARSGGLAVVGLQWWAR